MSQIPAELKYTAEHEWVRVAGPTTVVFGITDYAQDALGDLVFVTPPDSGSAITAGTPCGEVESTKSVSDLYAPVTGKVVKVNEALVTAPETLNTDPYGAGWIAEVEVADAAAAVADLLDAGAYGALTAG